MKFVSSYSKSDHQKASSEELYNKLGEPLTEDSDKVFAKYIATEIGNGQLQKKYFIRTHNNVPYDPSGPDSHREAHLKTDLKSVSKQTFDYYILYLKTKNSLYMTRAQRSFING